MFIFFVYSVAHIGEKSYLSCALDGVIKLSLMLCAGTRDPSRIDLASLGDESSQTGNILIVDVVDFSRTEFANLFPLTVGAEAAGVIICFIHDTLSSNNSERKVVVGFEFLKIRSGASRC